MTEYQIEIGGITLRREAKSYDLALYAVLRQCARLEPPSTVQPWIVRHLSAGTWVEDWIITSTGAARDALGVAGISLREEWILTVDEEIE